MRQAAALAGEAFDALHVRRTDAKFECPTDPVRDVAPYLECADSLRRSPLLLLFTDETSTTYLRDVYGLSVLTRGGRRVADGDALVRRALANYTDVRDRDLKATVYLVGKELQGLAETRYEMSRATCRATVLGAWENDAAVETAAACERARHVAESESTTTVEATARLASAAAAGRSLTYAGGEAVSVVGSEFRRARLFIGILTAAANVDAREAVRSTWLSYAGDYVHSFIVGLPYGNLLERENATTGDLVLVSIRDHYSRDSSALPLKSAVILWLAQRAGADFALKTDDDSFVRVPNLLAPLASYFGRADIS